MTLRNRKKKDGESETPVTQEDVTETTPRRAETSFRLVPLMQLPMYARLDVFPFAVLYALLIGTDLYWQYTEDEDDDDGRWILSCLLTVTLALHLGLVLACQWKESWQTLVGYHIGTTQSATKQWTHCWVQSKTATEETGIVAVTQDPSGVVVV